MMPQIKKFRKETIIPQVSAMEGFHFVAGAPGYLLESNRICDMPLLIGMSGNTLLS